MSPQKFARWFFRATFPIMVAYIASTLIGAPSNLTDPLLLLVLYVATVGEFILIRDTIQHEREKHP